MKVLKGYTDKIRLLTLPVLPLLMSLALMMMVVIGVNTTAVVANAQCSVYTFNGITGQLDCVTASGVNVITFATDGNERMRITQGGNVLVGTTTDDGVNLFQVDGSAAFATSVQTPIWNDVTLASGILSRAGTLGLSATGANVVTFSTNGVERVRTTGAGLTGFGTTAPLSVVSVVGASRVAAGDSTHFAIYTGTGAATDNQLLFGVYDANYSWIQATHPGTAFRNLVLQGLGGNVLIGTTTDDGASKLQVAGTIVSTTGLIITKASAPLIKLQDGSSSDFWLHGAAGGVTQVFGIYDNTALAYRLQIKSTGNVLFGGTTEGNYRLDVQSSGSTGTMRVYDQTATTGVTQFVVRAGAGQSTTNFITLQYNGGTEVTGIRTDQTTWVQNIHHFGSSLSTSDVRVTLGNARSGNGNSYIDLITDATYTTYGLRILRDNAGANGDSSILHRGTGVLSVNAFDAGSVDIKANNTSRLKVNNTGIGFFGVTPVARAAALTAADASALTSSDATVIGNMRTRIGELETKLQSYGLLN